MNELQTWLVRLAPLFAVFGLAVLAGLFHQTLHKLLDYLMLRPASMLNAVRNACWDASARVAARDLGLRTEEQMQDASVLPQRLFGSFLYSAVFLVVLANDVHLFSMLMESLGLGGLNFELPMSIGALIVLGSGAAATLWGAVLFDLLGKTRLMPYPRTRVLVRFMWGAAILNLFLLCAISVAAGIDRWMILNQSGAAAVYAPTAGSIADLTSGLEEERYGPASSVSLIVLVGHGLLMLCSTFVAWDGFLGLFLFAWLAIFRIAAACLWLLGLMANVLQALWAYASEVVLSTAEFALRGCERVAALFAGLVGRGMVDVGTRPRLLDDPVRETVSTAGDVSESRTMTPPATPDPAADTENLSDPQEEERTRNWNPYRK